MLIKEPWFGIRFVDVMISEHAVRTSGEDRSARWRKDDVHTDQNRNNMYARVLYAHVPSRE